MAITTSPVDLVVDFDILPDDFGEPPLSWPDINRINLDMVAVSYYAPFDLLSIDFLGGPVPAINMPLDTPDSDIGYAEARIGIPSGEVVGIEIRGYRSLVSNLHPGWANILEQAGEARREVLRDVIATVAAMPVYDGPPNSDV